jgi:hypothetical protein
VRFHFEMTLSHGKTLCYIFTSPAEFLILREVLASGGFCWRSLKPSHAL